jgi:hypothetical protein
LHDNGYAWINRVNEKPRELIRLKLDPMVKRKAKADDLSVGKFRKLHEGGMAS